MTPAPKAPKSDGLVDLRYRLTKEQRDELNAVAAERLIGPNVIVAKAVEEFLARLIPLDQLELVRPIPDGDHGTARNWSGRPVGPGGGVAKTFASEEGRTRIEDNRLEDNKEMSRNDPEAPRSDG